MGNLRFRLFIEASWKQKKAVCSPRAQRKEGIDWKEFKARICRVVKKLAVVNLGFFHPL